MDSANCTLTVRQAAALFSVPKSRIARYCWRVPGLAEKVWTGFGRTGWAYAIDATKLRTLMQNPPAMKPPGPPKGYVPKPRPPAPPRPSAPDGEATDGDA